MGSSLASIAESIRPKRNESPPDISMVMENINEVLDNSIAGVRIPESRGTMLDLSKIDFEALAKKFKQSKKQKTELEALKVAMCAQLEEMMAVNKTRADYAKRFEELIASYNNGSRTTKSKVQLAIQDALEEGLPRAFDKAMYESKCELLFLHVQERFPGSYGVTPNSRYH